MLVNSNFAQSNSFADGIKVHGNPLLDKTATDNFLSTPATPRVGLATDLWALGCVLYQLLAGRTPVWTAVEQEHEKMKETATLDRNDAKIAQRKKQTRKKVHRSCSARSIVVHRKVSGFQFVSCHPTHREKWNYEGFSSKARTCTLKIVAT